MTKESSLELVSVVIPCYKQADLLGEAIESVLAQHHARHEVVVIDDESPDNPGAVAAGYSNVRCIRQRRQERSAARNRGLEECRGEFVVFLDADDRLLPNHFTSCLEAFHQNPDLALVCGDYRWLGGVGTWHVHDCRPRPDHYASLLRTNFIGALHAVMFRREVLMNVGGFLRDLIMCEDQELYLRIARRHPIHCHHHVIAEYRRHGQQSSQRWDLMLQNAMRMLAWQRSAVTGRPDYEEAWRIGLDHRRRLYGAPLAWAMVHAARSGEWKRAARYFYVLLRWHPLGLIGLIRQKAERFNVNAA
jgi:glycosyltransferase involved in cell wall biosynthesis